MASFGAYELGTWHSRNVARDMRNQMIETQQRTGSTHSMDDLIEMVNKKDAEKKAAGELK